MGRGPRLAPSRGRNPRHAARSLTTVTEITNITTLTRSKHNESNLDQEQSAEIHRGRAAVPRRPSVGGGYTHVIVSATVVQFSGPETCIFGADLDEEDVVDWGELAGSFRGGLDHKYALQLAGYEVVEEQQT